MKKPFNIEEELDLLYYEGRFIRRDDTAVFIRYGNEEIPCIDWKTRSRTVTPAQLIAFCRHFYECGRHEALKEFEEEISGPNMEII